MAVFSRVFLQFRFAFSACTRQQQTSLKVLTNFSLHLVVWWHITTSPQTTNIQTKAMPLMLMPACNIMALIYGCAEALVSTLRNIVVFIVFLESCTLARGRCHPEVQRSTGRAGSPAWHQQFTCKSATNKAPRQMGTQHGWRDDRL